MLALRAAATNTRVAAGPAKSPRQGDRTLRRSPARTQPPPAAVPAWDFGNVTVLASDHRNSIGRSTAGALQTKLAIGSTNDPLEHEADRVADRVMRMAEPAAVTAAPEQLSRKCAACEEEDGQKLQTKRAGAHASVGEAPAAVHDVLRSPGRPLDAATRSFFEPRFGADFAKVRVHDDAPAADSANRVNAHAYAVGNHIVFAPNRFAPAAPAGRRLIAHELTHVMQQQGGDGARTLRREEKTIGGPLDLKVDPCVIAPGIGKKCGQQAVGLCEEHPGLPGCNIVCNLLGCSKKNEPKTQCPPGSRAAGSSTYAGQCCIGSGESAQNCCAPERIAALPSVRCCKDDETVDPTTKTCIKSKDIPADCPPEWKTTLGLCCFPPMVPAGAICSFANLPGPGPGPGPQTPQPPPTPTPTPGPQLGALSTETIHFQKDHPAPGETADARILTSAGQNELASVQQRLTLSPDLQVRLIGNASSEGDTAYNQRLSTRRVQFIGGKVAGRVADPVIPDGMAAGCASVGTGLWACGESRADQTSANPEDRVVKVTFVRNKLPPLQPPQPQVPKPAP